MPPELTPEPKRQDVVLAVANELDPNIIGTGALASLRRLDPTGALAEPALQRMLWRHVPERWLDNAGLFRWSVLLHAMSLAAPDLHRATGARGRLGEALFSARYSESRLVSLLESRPEDLAVAIPRAIRFLVAKSVPFSAVELSWFVFGLFDGGERAEEQRRRVAGNYYRAERTAIQTA